MLDIPIGYKPIDSGKFFEGMLVSADLYCQYRNNFVLVFKSSLLTQPLIQKIRQLEATYGNLYVEDKNYQKIIDQFEQYDAILKRLEFDTNYNSMKEKTSSIIDTTASTHKVSRSAVTVTSKIIQDKVADVDTSTIFQILNSVRDADEYLYTHSINVSMINGLIGKWMGLSEKEIFALVEGGLMHDIGKVKIDPAILNKPDALTENEFEIVKMHPAYSYNMLIEAGEINPDVLTAVRNHHERINGSGYPDGLKFDEISLYARITAVSDMYDAMVSQRCFRNAHSPFEVLEEFSKGSFTNLDIDIINIFLEKMPSDLIGKSVLLSNGMIGKVSYIDPDNFAFPLVQVGNKVIQTDNRIKCICMCQTDD